MHIASYIIITKTDISALALVLWMQNAKLDIGTTGIQVATVINYLKIV